MHDDVDAKSPVAAAPPGLRTRLWAYARLMRVDRPVGTLLLLWPTLWALWLAGAGRPLPQVFLVFVAGVFVMRSAGCVINDYADRDIDPHVARTRGRPLAAGVVRPGEALALFVSLMALALGLVSVLGTEMIRLSVIGAFLAATYPFLKRFTHLPQLYLGAAFGWGIPMAYAAHGQPLDLAPWLLFAANVCWAAAYDTMYAMADREDDLKIGVKSTAVLFGRRDRLMVALLQAAALALLLVVGELLGLGAWYRGGLLAAALFGLYQQYLIRTRTPAACFAAFLNNNWFGAAVFSGILLHYTFSG